MTVVARQSADLRSIADQFVSTAEQTRPTFTDQSRPQFDHRVVAAMRTEIRALAAQVSELDAALEKALRLLD